MRGADPVCHSDGQRPEESAPVTCRSGRSRSFAALRMTGLCFLTALTCTACQERGRPEHRNGSRGRIPRSAEGSHASGRATRGREDLFRDTPDLEELGQRQGRRRGCAARRLRARPGFGDRGPFGCFPARLHDGGRRDHVAGCRAEQPGRAHQRHRERQRDFQRMDLHELSGSPSLSASPRLSAARRRRSARVLGC